MLLNRRRLLYAGKTKYRLLTYIKTDGNSVIDTDVIVKKGITKLEIDCNITTSDNNHQIGCGGNDTDVIFFTRGFVYLLSASQGGTAFTIPINQRKKYIADAVNYKIGYEGNLITVTPTATQSADTFTIGARKNNGAYQLGSSDIIYDFKAYENNVLVKHLIPVERVSDNVIGMVDTISGQFYTNKGTGSFTKGDYVLDYLASTGTQYINLGNKSWNDGTDILETKFKYNQISTSSDALWLYSLQGTSMSFDFYSQDGEFRLRPYNVAQTVYRLDQDTNIHKLKLDCADAKIYLDDVVKYSSIQKASISNVPFNLFRRNTGVGYAKINLYNFIITRSGSRIVDLIPVKRASDNAICMYDNASGSYYTNSGSGSFTAGDITIVEY